jgi:hypothetical protein
MQLIVNVCYHRVNTLPQSQVCRQAYYNRKWSHRGDTKPLEEEEASQPERVVPVDANSIKTMESDFHSTIGERYVVIETGFVLGTELI